MSQEKGVEVWEFRGEESNSHGYREANVWKANVHHTMQRQRDTEKT